MSVINTNYLSLVAQNNLSKSQSALGNAIERLSSGLRINSAKDDAAGQAIANRMNAQVQGLNQAARNANDGISAAQTTEGALNQINDNLNRIRVLTVQAENGTNSQDDLDSIQNEIGQRLAEINRISEETEFNGIKVLASDQSLKIQVGANDDQRINIDLKLIDQESLGLAGFNVNGNGAVANAAATQADLDAASNVSLDNGQYYLTTDNTAVTAESVLSGVAETITVDVTAGATELELADYLAAGSANGFATAAGEVALDGLASDGNGGFTYSVTGAIADADIENYIKADAGEFTRATYSAGGASHDILIDEYGDITDADGTAMFITADGELTYDNLGGTSPATAALLSAALNDGDATVGSTLTLENGTVIRNDGDGVGTATTTVENVRVTAEELAGIIEANDLEVTTTTTASRDGAAGVDAIVLTGDNAGGTVTVSANGNDVYQNASGAFTQAAQEKVELFVRDNGNVTDIAANQYFVDADGEITANAFTEGGRTVDALSVLDTAIASVDALRSDLGAIQNRFESAIENLTTTSTNLAAAQSRIQDADYAVEVANMTRAQILQQAGTSVLAQANQIPQGVLSLLR